MKRREPQSVGDVLRNLLEESSLQNRMEELRAAELFMKIVGDHISSQIRSRRVEKGILTLGIPNASLRQELNMNRTSLKNLINKTIGKETILEIKFVS